MISQITGYLADIQEGCALVERDGICFEVLIPSSLTARLLNRMGKEISFPTICYLEGSAQGGAIIPRLAGFLTANDMEFFRYFISVQGIGYKGGLKALSGSIPEIARSIERGDERALCSLPGIGKRTASKIIAELKGKVGGFALRGMADDEPRPEEPEIPDFIDETLQVLSQLGYRPEEARRLVSQAIKFNENIDSAQELLPIILKKGG